MKGINIIRIAGTLFIMKQWWSIIPSEVKGTTARKLRSSKNNESQRTIALHFELRHIFGLI